MEFPDGLELGVICEREDPSDAFVSNRFATLAELAAGSVVGTSSLRRECQLRARRPDLEIQFLRGNVNTRLGKLDAGEYDAIVLAAAGLQRLDMQHRVSLVINSEELLPAVGQGALAVEYRSEDKAVPELLEPLCHKATQLCVAAERAMNKTLEGGCQVPIAGFAELKGAQLLMNGRVGAVDGSQMLEVKAQCTAPGELPMALAASEQLGAGIAGALLEKGAAELLAAT